LGVSAAASEGLRGVLPESDVGADELGAFDFGTGCTELNAAVSLLAPENALSEAMFF
jgi:hypothetical protein